MKVKVLKRFNDIKEKRTHLPGDLIEVSHERYEEINSTLHGLMVEEIESEPEAGPESEPEAGPESEPEAGPEAGPKDMMESLEEYTKKEILEYAQIKNIEIGKNMTKNEMIQAVVKELF